jgi:hypothetical protein
LFPISYSKITREKQMAKAKPNKEQTSPKAASAAGKVLNDPKSSKNAKTAAASALTQAPSKKKK